MDTINFKNFYNTWHGHTIEDLKKIYINLKKNNRDIIWLCGDSTLDNKFWVLDKTVNAVGDYNDIIDTKLSHPDIAYHITSLKFLNYHCINTAIEESTLKQRNFKLLSQDEFIRDNITSNDILIISIGGNDIAFSPTITTLYNLFVLVYTNTKENLIRNPASCNGIQYFINLFKTGIENMINKLISKNIPKMILVCNLYFPDICKSGGWADIALKIMKYDFDPDILQSIIKALYTLAISEIKIENVKTIPIALYDALDGNNTCDYVERVEPSYTGGQKLAELFINKIKYNLI